MSRIEKYAKYREEIKKTFSNVQTKTIDNEPKKEKVQIKKTNDSKRTKTKVLNFANRRELCFAIIVSIVGLLLVVGIISTGIVAFGGK